MRRACLWPVVVMSLRSQICCTRSAGASRRVRRKRPCGLCQAGMRCDDHGRGCTRLSHKCAHRLYLLLASSPWSLPWATTQSVATATLHRRTRWTMWSHSLRACTLVVRHTPPSHVVLGVVCCVWMNGLVCLFSCVLALLWLVLPALQALVTSLVHTKPSKRPTPSKALSVLSKIAAQRTCKRSAGCKAHLTPELLTCVRNMCVPCRWSCSRFSTAVAIQG